MKQVIEHKPLYVFDEWEVMKTIYPTHTVLKKFDKDGNTWYLKCLRNYTKKTIYNATFVWTKNINHSKLFDIKKEQKRNNPRHNTNERYYFLPSFNDIKWFHFFHRRDFNYGELEVYIK